MKGLKFMCSASEASDRKKYLANTHVPDKVYAYSLQIRHSFYELLECNKDDVVSIEVLDDVGLHRSNGIDEAIQIKSVLSSNNPISDRAVDLWKTLYNWLISIKENELCLDNALFKLYVAADRRGPIVASFDAAATSEEALSAWEQARLEFFDKGTAKQELSIGYAPYVTAFFDDENKIIACTIIQKFSLITIKESHSIVLYNLFCDRIIISEDLHELAFFTMLGWIEINVARMAELHIPMYIKYNDFRAQLIAVTKELNQKQSLIDLAPFPTNEQVESEYGSVRTYLAQLSIIDCDYTEQVQAISDYLRASTNRVKWAKRGDITENSYIGYQDSLIRNWNNRKSIIGIRDKLRPAREKGKLLFLECQEAKVAFNALSVPSFFVAGCYHELSDKLTIGWHPDYQKILSGENKNG